jgi:Predicted membrane protein (DUF2232).
MLTIALLPIIVCLWVALKKRLSFLGSVQLSCLGFALSVLIAILSVYFVTGKDIVTYVLDDWRLFLQQNDTFTYSFYAAIQMVTGGTVNSQISLNDAVGVVYPFFQNSIVYGIPAACAASIPLGGLVSFLIVRAIVKKAGAKVTPVPAFADFKLPAKFGRWSVIILIVCWIGAIAGWRNFDFVLSIAFAFFGSIYYVLGMAFMEWLLKKQIKSAVGRGFIIALLAIVLCQLYVFTFIGLFEQLAKFRQRANSNKVGL